MRDRQAWTQAMVCRVPSCVALAADLEGICIAHEQLPADELEILLRRAIGLVPPLRPVAVGIEYECADGSQYGIDHDGNRYEVRGPR